MMENLNSKIENSQMKINADEGIDLKLIINILLRNKSLISLISFLTFIFGISYSLRLNEVWEGQFQIVINNEKPPTIIPDISPELATLAGLGGTVANELETEVEILKSPSVLMPVFEFAKSKESPENQLKFSNWKSKLKIELKKETSVLNISYKDTNKERILPILNKMSTSYQQYSGKNTRRSQELTNNFLKEQISLFKKKSANSLKAAQEYAIDQDLVFYDSGKEPINDIANNPELFLGDDTPETPYSLSTNILIENARVQAANQIRKINLQLMQIKELNNSEELKYIALTIPALVTEGFPLELSEIESDLTNARSIYNDKDIVIVNLIKKRNLAIDLLKNKTIKYLEVEKLNAEATMQALMRPKGVLLKYKELIREAARDEETLIKLEDRFNLFTLDLASKDDPWELITKPTLLEKRVSPNRRKIAFLSLIIGFLLGTAASIFKEKQSGRIYDTSEIEKLIPIKLISEINLNKIEIETQNLLFIQDLLNEESNSVVNFVPIGNIEEQELAKLKDVLMKEKFTKDIKFSSNKDEIKEYSNYLILKLGYIKYSDISILKKRLELIENVFNGLLILV